MKDYTISNFDESSFQIEIVVNDQVYISLNYKAIYNINIKDWKIMTIIALVNYGTIRILTITVFKGIYHLYKYLKYGLDNNILFIRSPIGFTNHWLSIYYIKHFDKFYLPSWLSKYHILIFDSYRSNIGHDFLNYY
jgi:hypothetical protein